MQQTNKIVIYEPAMCCSSGVCGPSLDQALIGLQDTLAQIVSTGVQVERYTITQNPRKFMENPQVMKLIQEQQLKALPITTLNGRIVAVGLYPTLEEFQRLSRDKDSSPEVLTTEKGCCSEKDACDIRCRPQNNTSCCGDTENSSCC